MHNLCTKHMHSFSVGYSVDAGEQERQSEAARRVISIWRLVLGLSRNLDEKDAGVSL